MLKITNEDIKQIDLKNFSSELIKRTPSEEYGTFKSFNDKSF